MGISASVQKWFTLMSHCLATFSNAMCFGIFFSNIPTFSAYYNVSQATINNSFYIGLICEIIFCIPALKMIEWRLDYSVISGSFISMASYWIQFFAGNNFIVSKNRIIIVICCMIMSSLGQAILLPMSAYLAERWFPLEQRSIAIGLSFYGNLLGFATGAIFTAIYIDSN